MAGSIPDTEEQRIAEDYVRNTLSLRLYSNDVTPDESSSLSSFTQVSGGGYAAKSLLSASWTATPGDPTVLEYAEQEFLFTGTTTAPGTIYGYYLVDTVTGLYIGGERFPGSVLPVTPVAGSKISITPTVQVS
jgi:hypothetical protein